MGGDQLRPNINIKDMVNSYITLIDADSNIINLKFTMLVLKIIL